MLVVLQTQNKRQDEEQSKSETVSKQTILQT